MFNPSPATIATTSPVSPSSPTSPQRPSRLRGLSYLRNYTHSHLHSRDNNNESPSSPRRLTLTRATSYPSPSPASTSNPSANRSGGSGTTPVQSPTQRPPPSIRRSTADRESLPITNQENTGATSGWLPTVGGQSGVSRIATQPQSTTESSSGLLSGADNSEDTASAIMGRTRSAIPGPASGPDISQMDGGRDSHLQYDSVPVQSSNGGNCADAGNQLPSIRFSQYQDVRAPRPSLVFSPMGRTLPTGREIIRVGRYSERENQPNAASNVPSAAPIGFKSKVVSRRHCEFWYQDGGWFIKDVKSSSGTFLNHVRLSSPGTESKPFPVKDGDIVQLGIDFKGGEEMIFRCVKIRIELNRGWQNALNSFNVASHKRLRNMAKQNLSPTSASSSQDCTICLGAVAPCQSLFVAPCSHTWHYKCVRRIINGPMWPQFVCPNCRAVADLEADVDDPFPDAEWEDVEAADAVDEQNPRDAVPSADVAPILHLPLTGRNDANSRTVTNGISEQDVVDESQGDDSTGSDLDLQQAMRALNVSPREPSAAQPTQQTHSSIGPVDIRPGRQTSRHDNTSNTATTDFDIASFMRNDRTPSPTGRLPPGVGDILTGPDGPITPRNDAGPFVFDGSAGRAAGARMSALNLAIAEAADPATHRS